MSVTTTLDIRALRALTDVPWSSNNVIPRLAAVAPPVAVGAAASMVRVMVASVAPPISVFKIVRRSPVV